MAEKQTQTKPQFIMWVKDAGVFKLAELRMPHDYTGYRLERNVKLGERKISPDILNLVSSVYLGPINIFEDSSDFRTDKIERLRQHRFGTILGIKDLAEKVAKNEGVPYFALSIIQTSKERTWKSADYTLTEEKNTEYDLTREYLNFEKPKPIEFVLHPTAQLYVPYLPRRD